MFENFAQIVQEASLLGLNMTFKPMGKDNFSVILSFMAAPITDQGVYSERKGASDSIDAVLALRNALAVPLVITGKPAELNQKLVEALNTLKASVVEASMTFNAIDISALLKASSTKAATVAKAAKPAQAKPADKVNPEQANTEAVDPDEDNIHENDDAAYTGSVDAQKPALTPTSNIADFDSL